MLFKRPWFYVGEIVVSGSIHYMFFMVFHFGLFSPNISALEDMRDPPDHQSSVTLKTPSLANRILVRKISRAEESSAADPDSGWLDWGRCHGSRRSVGAADPFVLCQAAGLRRGCPRSDIDYTRQVTRGNLGPPALDVKGVTPELAVPIAKFPKPETEPLLSRTSVNRSRLLRRSDMLLLQFVTDVVCLAIHGHFQRI
jgi:hypothetical protein